nr:putative ribonuclease H-like domain-containing protein [Tanacetum cinerariifolium]
MSTQQDIYAAGSENRPPMLNKDNYVPWSSRIIRYARSRPNGKIIVNSIKNGPYVRRMIATPREPDLPVPVLESLHEQTDEELTGTDIKRMDADDQAIQTILLGLPEDVYAAEEVNELRAERLTKSHDPLALMAYSHNSFNFPTTYKDQSSFSTHPQQSFPINNKYNPQPPLNQNFMKPPMTSLEDINNLTEATNAALILFAKAFQLSTPTNNNQRTSSNPRNLAQNQQGFNAWKNGGIQGAQNAGVQSGGNQNGLVVVPGIASHSETGNVVAARAEAMPRRRDDAYLQTRLLIAQKEEAGIQLQAKEFDFMATAGDLDEIEEVNANCILMANLQQASTSGTQHDRAPVYDTDGSAGETLKLSQESREKMRLLKKEIKPANYAKINHLSGVFVPQTTKSKKELFLSNVSNMVTASKTISIPNEDLSDDTTPSVARKFLNEVKSSLVTLQRVVKQKMTLEIHNWLSSSHKEVHRIISHEIAPIINQVDARVQNFEIQFLQEAAKFVRDFKSLAKEADESLDKQNLVDVPSDLQTELDHTKEKLKLCIIKKEKEYVVLWNNWYTKCEECKYDKISYDKAYNELQQKVERLQDQLRDLKGKSSNTPSVSNTLDTLNQKLESKIVELEFQVVNYEREISHLKTTYKNLSDSIKSNRAHAKLHDLIFENAKLRAWLFENTSESMKNISETSVTPHVDKPKLSAITPLSKKLHINPSQTPRVDLVPNKQSSASIRTNPITNSQRHVIVKENVSSNMVTASSIGLVHTARIRRPQPKGNTRNARIPYASKSSEVKKNRHRTQVWKPKQVGSKERLASKPRLPRLSLKWSPSGRSFDQKGKLVASKGTNFPNDGCPNLSVVHRLGLFQAYDREHQASHQLCVEVFRNCMLWVYFVEGLGHNLFSVGQFCDADLEVAFRRNTCFIRDLDGVDLLKGNHSINLYTINLYDMASASPICLMARATPTKSRLWHQRLSHLNFDTINDLAKNDHIFGLPKFKYAKEHLCPSCEQGKSKRASQTPKPVPISKQRLHLLHMDLCGPMRVASINGKRYVLVIVDDYSRYTWVHFLRTKDETLEVIKNFLKKIYVHLQAPVIIVRTDNGTEFKNHVLKEYFDSVGITHETSAAKTPQQNGVVKRRNRTLVEVARTMLIFSHALLFLWAEAIATACYTQNRFIIH